MQAYTCLIQRFEVLQGQIDFDPLFEKGDTGAEYHRRYGHDQFIDQPGPHENGIDAGSAGNHHLAIALGFQFGEQGLWRAIRIDEVVPLRYAPRVAGHDDIFSARQWLADRIKGLGPHDQRAGRLGDFNEKALIRFAGSIREMIRMPGDLAVKRLGHQQDRLYRHRCISF